ncbi:uncharacterized protein Hap1MRO34_014744 [Clarias gariepinus]
MCIDTMTTERRMPRERRPNCYWRRRKAMYTKAAAEADVRQNTGKSLRKSGRRSRSLAWEKKKSTHAFPSGAMAPRNTTQYLMELNYSDLNIRAQTSGPSPYLQSHYADDEDSMDFEHRDFESVFFHTEIETDAIWEAAILETKPLNAFKINRRACAAGGSWLCVMWPRPECKLTPPTPAQTLECTGKPAPLQVCVLLCCICCVLCVREFCRSAAPPL